MQPCNATSDATCMPCARSGGMSGCNYATTTARMQTTSTIPNTTSIPEATPPPPPPLIASVIIAKTYTEVCSNTSYYVDGICQGLHETNPDDTFACRAQSLNGQDCLNGVCTCVNNKRRLLQDSCNLTMHVEHTLQTEPKVAKFRPWVQEIVIVVVEQPSDNLVLLIAIAGVVIVCTCVIVYAIMRRPVVIVVPKSATRAAFHSLKIL